MYPTPSQTIVVRLDSSSWMVNFAPVICSATQIAVLDVSGLEPLSVEESFHSLTGYGG